jgi:hypothetical protein
MDYFEVAKGITRDYAERIAKDDLILRQADVIETLQKIVTKQGELIETLKQARQA